ncbi:MAG: hypothetical protein ACLRTA_01860 [Clostridia bacterium]
MRPAVEDTLLQPQVSEEERKQTGDPIRMDIFLDMLECSLKLLRDAIHLDSDAQMTLIRSLRPECLYTDDAKGDGIRRNPGT